MARKEAVFGMKVDTGNSVNEMKSLDKEFQQLNDQMKIMEKNGDTNTDAFKHLSKAVKESGQQIEKAFEESQKELAKFSGDMEHLGDEILVEVSGSISKMEDRMYELALAGDTTSKEFRELQSQTAKYKKIIIETDRSIDALAEQGQGLSTALSISSGAVAGFQAYTGVTALLGDENEELLATITKLQGAQGVLNSIETIKQQLDAKSIVLTRARTKAQALLSSAIKKTSKAFVASGIGAVILLVGALIANFGKLKEMIGGVSEAQKVANQVSNMALDSYSKQASASDQLKKIINDENTSREDQITAVKNLQEKYPNLLSNIDAESASVEEVNKAISLNIRLLKLKAEAEAINELRAEKYKEQLQEQMDVQTGANVGMMDYLTTNLLWGDVQETALENSKETIKGIQKETTALDDLLVKKQEAIDLAMKEGAVIGAPKTAVKEKTDKGTKDTSVADAKKAELEQLKQFALEQTQLEDELFKMRMTARELEEQNISERFDSLLLKAHGNAELEKQLVIQQETELNAIRKEHADKTAQEQADAIKTSNALRHSLMRESLTEDLKILEEKYTAEREALQINELISSEEKIVLMSEIKERELAEEDLIKQKWNAKEVEDEKKKVADKQAIRNAGFDSATKSLEGLASLNSLITDMQLKGLKKGSDEELKVQKKSFERGKAINIAMATISGIQGVINTLSAQSVIPEPFGTVVKVASAAALGISTISNISKIKNQKFGGGSAGASASTPSVSTGANASSFAISDDTSSAQTELNPDGTVATGSGQNKVVVVETDITNAVNNVAQIEELSTF